MGDVLAAIGLAGNIVQFVDFSVKLVANGQELYQSTNGSLKENGELEEIAKDVKSLSKSLVVSKSGDGLGVTRSRHGKALKRLAVMCVELADELLALLQSLKVDRNRNRIWGTINKSIRGVRKRGYVRDIEMRLCKVKEQVSLHLIFLLNYRLSVLFPAVNDMMDAAATAGIESQTKADNLMSELQNFIQTQPWATSCKDDYQKLYDMVKGLAEKGSKATKEESILASLHFKQMKVRQSDVKGAHVKTFEWVFSETEKLTFVKWLRSENGVFWNAGKAGSGKSTLMKFLFNHPRTLTLLKEWTGQSKLVVASHFFWSAGTQMQKSQEGLLRTLLYQVLIKCPDLVPILCPGRWDDSAISSYRSSEQWTCSELFGAFEALAGLDKRPVRFCFFIDGLDEYEGENQDIINIIKTLATSHNIKLCVSSRPWTAFVDAFGKLEHKLFLQDLTRNDIKLYVQDILEEDPRFKELKSRDSGSDYFVQQIVNRAQGVFLWVFLVVRSLLRGLTSDDDISDLKRRLEELPVDLETYFNHMLKNIENVYQQQTAQFFQVTVHATTTLSVLAFYFLEFEKEGPRHTPHSQVKPLSDIEILAIVNKKRRQLNARCKDLLEVNEHPEEPTFFRYTVGFLHRTVLDFLRTNDMHNLLTARSGSNFNPKTSLCNTSLAQIKALKKPQVSMPGLQDLVTNIIEYSHESEFQDGIAQIAMLDEMDRAIHILFSGRYGFWKEVFRENDGSLALSNYQNITFLEVAVNYPLHIYVAQKLIECPSKASRAHLLGHLLRHAPCLIGQNLRGDNLEVIDLEMLRLLLAHGANPNHRNSEGTNTVWSSFLYQCFKSGSSGKKDTQSNWYKVCELLIQHGANSPTDFNWLCRIFSKSEAEQLNSLQASVQA